jgi:hypothetical protein
MVNRQQVLSLYRELIRKSKGFENYNFRSHALRKTRWEFKKNKSLQSSQQIYGKYEFGRKQLEILNRQITIGKLYPEEASVMENAVHAK